MSRRPCSPRLTVSQKSTATFAPSISVSYRYSVSAKVDLRGRAGAGAGPRRQGGTVGKPASLKCRACAAPLGSAVATHRWRGLYWSSRKRTRSFDLPAAESPSRMICRRDGSREGRRTVAVDEYGQPAATTLVVSGAHLQVCRRDASC